MEQAILAESIRYKTQNTDKIENFSTKPEYKTLPNQKHSNYNLQPRNQNNGKWCPEHKTTNHDKSE